MTDGKHRSFWEMPFVLTMSHGRWEHGSLADVPPLPHQGLAFLSLRNRLVMELERSRRRTLVLVVRIYLGTRRWMFCLPI